MPRPRFADDDTDDFDDGFEPFDGDDADDAFAMDDHEPPPVIFRDPYGVLRELSEDGGGLMRGYHDIGDGPQPYWLPRAVVATWERLA